MNVLERALLLDYGGRCDIDSSFVALYTTGNTHEKFVWFIASIHISCRSFFYHRKYYLYV